MGFLLILLIIGIAIWFYMHEKSEKADPVTVGNTTLFSTSNQKRDLKESLLKLPSSSPEITKNDMINLLGEPDAESKTNDGNTLLDTIQWFGADIYICGYWFQNGSFSHAAVLDKEVSDQLILIDNYLITVRRLMDKGRQ